MTSGISFHPHLLVSSALLRPLMLSIFNSLWVTNLLVFNIPCEFCLRLTNYLLTSCLYLTLPFFDKDYLFNCSQRIIY